MRGHDPCLAGQYVKRSPDRDGTPCGVPGLPFFRAIRIRIATVLRSIITLARRDH
jgi:hypothetical protein